MEYKMTTRAQDLVKSDNSEKAKKETNDCVVYAFASAFDLEYDAAHQEVKARFSRQQRKGTKTHLIIDGAKGLLGTGETVNGKAVVEYLEHPKQTYKAYGEVVPRAMRVSSFAARYSQGTYLVLIRGHALTIKNGVIIDNLRRSRPSSIVQYAFKIGEVLG